MTLPATLQSLLAKGETVLWEGKPDAPKKLSAYRGWYDWVARGFFAISSIMALLYIMNRSETAVVGLSWGLIGFVGGPLLIGFLVRFGFAWRARKAMRNLHYVVTTRRVLINTRAAPMTFTITPDLPIEMITGRKEKDVVQITGKDGFRYVDDTNVDPAVYTNPRGMILPRAQAAAAFQAITAVKEAHMT